MLRSSVGKPAAEWLAPECQLRRERLISCNGGAPMPHELKRDCRVRIFPKPSERLRCRSWFCHGIFEGRTAAGFGIRTPIGCGGGRHQCRLPSPPSPLPHFPQPRHVTTIARLPNNGMYCQATVKRHTSVNLCVGCKWLV